MLAHCQVDLTYYMKEFCILAMIVRWDVHRDLSSGLRSTHIRVVDGELRRLAQGLGWSDTLVASIETIRDIIKADLRRGTGCMPYPNYIFRRLETVPRGALVARLEQ